MIDNAFAITVLFIIISTFVALLFKHLHRDKCLKDFKDFMVTLEKKGKCIWGRLRVESTGIELLYPDKHQDSDHIESSYILYKFEFPSIQVLIRYHDDLSDEHKIKRNRDLKRTYHPGFLRRSKRKLLNFFKTIRDAIAEIMNLLLIQAQKTRAVGSTLKSQDKYVSEMKKGLLGSVGTSFEPLLERYIGHKVVLEVIKNDLVEEYAGLLKDYTADFIEIMDVDYASDNDTMPRKADIIASRNLAIVRHLAE